MRCPSCNKFVSFDTEVEPEENSLEVDAEGNVEASYRRVLTCQECGEELKECEFELSHAIEASECSSPEAGADKHHEWEVAADDVQPTETQVGRKTRYGVLVHVSATCNRCDATAEFDMADEASAGSFEELT